MGQTADELRRDIADTRNDLGHTLDAIGDRISPGRIVKRRKNRVARTLSDVRDRVMGTAVGPGSMTDRAGSAASSAVEATRHTPDLVRERTEGNPLMAGFIAMGAGFLIATILPASSKERELGSELRDRAQPLVDELTEAGRETAEHLSEPLRHAADDLKSSARESAREVTETARQEAGEVRDTASGPASPNRV